MFKKHEDGTYSFSARFWTYAIIASVIIVWIGWRTQDTANKVERQARETSQFAAANNMCINQILATIKDRNVYTDRLAVLDGVHDKAVMDLIVNIAKIDPNLRTPERDVVAREVLTKFFTDINEIDKNRADALAQRAANPFPEPNCGFNSPGQ